MHGQTAVDSVAVTDLVVTDINGHNPVELPRAFMRDEILSNHSNIPKMNILRQWLHASA